MSIHGICIFLIASFFLVSNLASGMGQEIDVTSAIKILTTTKPIPYPATVMGSVDLNKRKWAIQLYGQQMMAIHVLGQAKANNTAQLLIPYLNYSIPEVDPLDPPFPKEDLAEIRSKWPVFSVLLDMPGAGQALEDYSLESNNPLRYRISAFLVLRYVDANRFNKVSAKFNQEFNNATPRLKKYLEGIENGKAFFYGVIPVEVYPK